MADPTRPHLPEKSPVHLKPKRTPPAKVAEEETVFDAERHDAAHSRKGV